MSSVICQDYIYVIKVQCLQAIFSRKSIQNSENPWFSHYFQEKNNCTAKASLIITQQQKTTAAESRNFRWATNSYYFLDNNFHDDCMALSSPLVHNVQCRSTCLRYTQNEHVHAVHAVAATNTQCKGSARGAAGMAMGDGQVCAQSCAGHQFFISV